MKDYRREAGLPVSTDTTGDFDKRLIATYQKRKGLNVTEVVDEKTLEQIGNDVKNLRHEHGQNYISMDLTAATLPDKPLATPSTQPSAGHSTVPR